VSASLALDPLTQEAFLTWEAEQPARFEFAHGVIRAMTGGTQQHDRLRGAIFAALHRQLRGKPCRASLDVRIACPNGNVRYPDVAIDCGPFDPKGINLREPRLVVEVLSPSTTATDYLVKTEDYSSVPSIAQYWIASQEEPRIDVLMRKDGKLTLAASHSQSDAVLAIDDIGISMTLAEIYQE
jgi:Uma2 family endonuclease